MSYCTFEEFLACIEGKPQSSQARKNEIRAITLWQPWASLIALLLKQYETRSWPTKYRGKLLIHAAARPGRYHEKQAIVDQLKGTEHYASMVKLFGTTDLPVGCIVAIADLTNCLEMIEDLSKSPSVAANIHLQTSLELAVGDWQAGRYAWRLENIQALQKHIPCKGKQGLWIPSQEIITAVGGMT